MTFDHAKILELAERHELAVKLDKSAPDFHLSYDDMAVIAFGLRSLANQEAARAYARRLATALWEKHWKIDAPEWQPLPDLMGLLTQIDNATAGLRRAYD